MIADEFGKDYNVGERLGEGGQGTVFRAMNDKGIVIKCLMSPTPVGGGDAGCNETEQLILRDEVLYGRYAAKIHSIMALGMFCKIRHVAMPQAVLSAPCCGYTMQLMDGLEDMGKQIPRSDKRSNVVSSAGTNGSLKKKMRVLKELAAIMLQLHRQGLVYCDLSPLNIFISENADDHEVWLIDSDNLVFANRSIRCIGTPEYSAPEIVTKKSANSFYSDMYSFALVAFRYLTGENPFVSADGSDDWDSNDASDGNDVGDAPYMYEEGQTPMGIPIDMVCTQKLKELFYRTFCRMGRNVPSSRPTAVQWYEAFDEAEDMLKVCLTPSDDNGSPRGNVLQEVNHYFLGDECLWCKLQGVEVRLPQTYLLEVSPLVKADDDWENTSPSAETNIFARKKYISYLGRPIVLPAKYVTGRDLGEKDDRMTLTVSSKTLKLSCPNLSSGIKFLREGLLFNGECPSPDIGKSLELTVQIKKKPVALFRLTRIK